MSVSLKKVIETSTLILHKETFIVAKVSSAPAIGKHFLVVKDSDEITVITEKENVKELDPFESSLNERRLLEIQFSPDSPDSPGFLAAISSALAEEGISISVVSTFSKDYLLVHEEDTEKAMKVFRGLLFKEIRIL